METAVIRVDASVEMGIGHVMRCLTLAEELKDNGYNVIFITGDHKGNLAEQIHSKGFTVIKLHKSTENNGHLNELQHSHWLGTSQEEDAKEVLNELKNIHSIDLMVLDHYAIDYRWEQLLKDKVKKIFVIDDLADRRHECDVLLDQNFYLDMKNRYAGLVNKNCKLLLGPEFALLRKEFNLARTELRVRNGEVRRILVFFGGSDPTNETLKVVKAIGNLDTQNIIVDVVVGASNPNKDRVKKLTHSFSNMNFHCQISNMADFLLKADIAIGAGGSSTWERMYMGVPSIIITVAQNQIQAAKDISEKDAIIYLGHFDKVEEIDILNTVKYLNENPLFVKKISENASKIIDSSKNRLSALNYL